MGHIGVTVSTRRFKTFTFEIQHIVEVCSTHARGCNMSMTVNNMASSMCVIKGISTRWQMRTNSTRTVFIEVLNILHIVNVTKHCNTK